MAAWCAAQNERTRAVLDSEPSRPRWHARLVELLRAGQSGAPRIRGQRVFSLDRWGEHDQAVLVVRSQRRASVGRLLLDPAALLGDATASIDWYEPDRAGDTIALGLSTGGSEQSTLRLLDVGSGLLLDDEIPDTRACSVAWEPDGTAFFYTCYPEGDEYHRHVRRHVVGEDPSTDEIVLGPDALPDPTAWPSVALSRDARWLLASMSLGWSRTDLRLLDRPAGTWVSVIEGIDALTTLTFDTANDRLLGVTTLGADRGRVVAVELDGPTADRWVTLSDEDSNPRRVLDWAMPLPNGDRLVRTTHWGAAELWHQRGVFGADGGFTTPVTLPGGGVVDIVGADIDDLDGADGVTVLVLTSFTQPARLHHWTPEDGIVDWAPLPGTPSLVGLRASQTSFPADDGTAIPVFLVDGVTTPSDGARTILTGYGGFNITETPAYSPLIAAWCEAGGRFAIAGIRGGAEEGEAWHRAGMRENKQRCFDDFFGAADWLVDSGRTTRDRLALRGGSNGGLLMGACITQRPDLAAAVHCAVPLLDMLRFHLFLIARLWTPEYGDPDLADEFAWLHAYSPYHRVVDGTCYPATFITTAEEDTRVHPFHARKFAAWLQAATACGQANLVLLRVESRAGHGVGKPVGKQADEAADVLTFIDSHLTL